MRFSLAVCMAAAILAAAALSACTQPNAPHGNETAAAMPDTSARTSTTAPDADQTGQVKPEAE